MRQNTLFARAVAVCLFIGLLIVPAFPQQQQQQQDSKTGEGALHVIDKEGRDTGLCPLKNTFVRAEISGFLSRVTVTQTFQNPFNEAIEAVYTFPLPNDAAVDDMTITIGERVVKSRIMERKQAQAAYEKAKQEGKVAALLMQQRPNIFTQAVANITPGAQIKVVISYVETLKYADDGYEFRFPMTIAQRYIPSTVDAEDAARITPESKARPGHTISLELEIDAGVSIENIASNTHEIAVSQFSASRFAVRLRNDAEIPNRDFVLKYKTAGTKIEDAILAHKDKNGGFFTLILQPPDKIMPQDTTPKEIVFVLDTSGSMAGFPIEKAREAMKLTLDNLNPYDTFNLITFAGETRILFKSPVPATPENLDRARRLLDEVESDGGTEMMKAIKAALRPSDSQQHVRIVCFMTDGVVGNEAEIIAEVKKYTNARVFAFGIGSSVNHYLLDEISREGRGEVEYVSPSDDGSAAARRFYERIRNPLLTDVALEFQGVQTAEIFPQRIPDLFDAKPVVAVGRYAQGGRGKVILRGKMQGQPFSREIEVDFPEQNARNDVLATLWARRKIAELTRQNLPGSSDPAQKSETKNDVEQAIMNLGLEFRLLTPYTSFVAFDEQMVTDGTQTRKVEVPVADVENAPINARYVTQLGQTTGVSASVTIVDTSTGIDSTSTSIVTTREVTSYIDRGKGMQAAFSTAGNVAQVNENRSRFQPGLISVTGQRPTSNYFTIDELSANTGAAADETSVSGNIGALPNLTAAGGTNSLTALDATTEVTLRTLADTKEGRAAGATINFVSKRGNNNYRGSLFETFGNEAFNANDFFANSRGLSRPAARLNQFGGTLGGFLRKDKAWFFGNYEGLRLRQPAFSISEVPGLASRQNAAAANVRPLLDAFPVPNGRLTANGFAEFAATFTNPAAHDIFGLRIDAQPLDELSVSGRYNFSDSKASLRGEGDFSLNTRRNLDARSSSLSLLATYTLSNSAVLNARANFSRSNLAQSFALDDFGGANVSPLISNAAAGSPFSFLKFDLAGKNSALAAGSQTETTINQFQVNGALEWVVNNNTLAFGADFRRLSFDVGAQPAERSVLFSGVNTSGTALRINELTRTGGRASALENLSLFGQDAWRVSSNLNLSFGLRWNMDFAPETGAGNINFRNASPQMRDMLKNLAPRAGFAFDPFGSGKSVLRGSAGLYYDFGNAAASEVFANSFPFVAGGNFARNVNWTASPTSAFKPLIAFDADLRTPRAWKIFAEYQQEIFDNNVVTVNYTGAFGRGLLRTRTFLNADPDYNFARLATSDGESDYHAANLLYDKRFSQGFSISARYTLAKSLDNFSLDTFRRNLFVGENLSDERAASDFDARHQFAVYGAYDIPAAFGDSGSLNFLTRDWMIFGFANARTALPVNVTYARVNDFGVQLLRPDLIADAPLYIADASGGKQINPAAFSIPVEGGGERQGTLGRNALRGFPFFQLDLGLERRFRFGNESNLRLTMTILNVLNRANFADMSGNLGTLAADSGGNYFVANSYFGQATSTFGSRNFTPFYLYGGARTIQFSAKYVF
ncbi:MAG: VWA domain-containing protein [Acidobacteriota bacterium]|nr:VWA domain-containing protein [Acidobacteriota bacterium]